MAGPAAGAGDITEAGAGADAGAGGTASAGAGVRADAGVAGIDAETRGCATVCAGAVAGPAVEAIAAAAVGTVEGAFAAVPLMRNAAPAAGDEGRGASTFARRACAVTVSKRMSVSMRACSAGSADSTSPSASVIDEPARQLTGASAHAPAFGTLML